MQLHQDAPRLAMPDRAESVARMKIDRATWAGRAFAKYDRAAVMKVARAVAEAAHQAAGQFAEAAVAETGMGVLLITHYTRILRYIKPGFVHVFVDGRIAEEGGPELAERLENEGYDRFLAPSEVA